MTEASIDLEEISSRLGFAEVPEVLEASATPIRRGHHLALLAGRGSGKTSVVALAVLEACDASEETLQAMVLVPEAGYAWSVAAAVQRVVGSEGFTVACPSAVPGDDGASEIGRAVPAAGHVLVGRPSELLPEVRAGHYSLSGLRLLVLDGIAGMHALDEWTSVEPILETLPDDSRKLAISDRVDPAFTRLIERQLPRARRWPEDLLPSAAAPAEQAAEQPLAPVRCALVPATGFVEAFRRCVRDADGLGCGRIDLVFPTRERAARAAAELTVAGLSVAGGAGEEDEKKKKKKPGAARGTGKSGIVTVELPGEGPPAVVHIGLPSRQESLENAFAGEGPRYAVVEPRHAPQMELHVRRLNRHLDPLGGQRLTQELDPVRRYRTQLRETAENVDPMSELLVLEPLFEEMGAVRLAAVLSELLRRRGDTDAGSVRSWADMEAASSVGAAPSAARTRRRVEEIPRGARPAWTRLYFGVGRRDDASPGDLVGAITGETGIAGAQVGKIEIMGNFSLVEVDSQVADAVIRKLDGVQIRGRDVPVRRDRDG